MTPAASALQRAILLKAQSGRGMTGSSRAACTARLAPQLPRSDDDAIHALIPYMKTETYAAGDVLFARGESGDTLYIVQQGQVVFREINKHVSAGAVIGEAGLLAPQGVRFLSAICEDNCRLSTIAKEKVVELYYQNPRLGLFLIRLVSGLLLDERSELDPPSNRHSPLLIS
jgi:CRP-like cAMP-binding protein